MTLQRSIGLIAGRGELPLYFARQARQRGFSLSIAAIRGAASPRLEKMGKEFTWLSVGQLGGLLSFFKKLRVHRVVMHGKIQHAQAFQPLKLDWKTLCLLKRLKDRSGEGILNAVAGELFRAGIRLLDGRFLMSDLMPQSGCLTRTTPRKAEMRSFRRGLKCARQIAALGVGQTVVMKKEAVVAVEALEGTDETILRAGFRAGRGTIAVKTAGPRQDWRFDIPTVGVQTIRSLAKAGARGIVLEAGKCFLVNGPESAALADKNSIFILAV
jgi:DUF1009 family protein